MTGKIFTIKTKLISLREINGEKKGFLRNGTFIIKMKNSVTKISRSTSIEDNNKCHVVSVVEESLRKGEIRIYLWNRVIIRENLVRRKRE